ncbi:hypothetical protein [Eisenibacter elegans]|uniref:hypothetical protein n=1 Tax=Eisenibacter elegans TaxID=997 RepID=UPI000683D9F8|nr:hypothetical protein [Eisenibacter elegans]
MTPELQKISLLLESDDRANVRLALQLAQSCPAEFEAHYGITLEDLRIITAARNRKPFDTHRA